MPTEIQKRRLQERKIPTKLSEALRFAAELAEQNEMLEQALSELRLSGEYPEVLRPAHIIKLLGTSAPTITEWARDPSFPILNRGRKKGEAILVLKSDLYQWLKTRNQIAV